MLASWTMTSKQKGVDGPTQPFRRALTYQSSFCFSMDGLVDWSIIFSAGWGESTICSPYYFKYYLSDRVFDVGGALVSVAKADSYSPELVREATSSSVSLIEIPTTLLEDVWPCYWTSCLWQSSLLAFDNVRMNPHCLSSRSRNRDKTFLLLVMRICIDHFYFPFRDGNHFGWH